MINEELDIKNRFLESNKNLNDLFNELLEKYNLLKVENENLVNKKLKSTLKSTSKFGIINLSKLNGEAVFDAINHFNKLCPYCKTDLYAGHIRNNYEIDHFFPIAKGGQDVPWNLLPICRDCNRKKRDKLPFEYLDETTYETCNKYLEGVLYKITNNHEDRLQRDEILHSLIMNVISDRISKDEFINIVYRLFDPTTTLDAKFDANFDLNTILSEEKINSCTEQTYFNTVNVMKIKEVRELGISRKTVTEVLTKLYGEPDKNKRYYKSRRQLYK